MDGAASLTTADRRRRVLALALASACLAVAFVVQTAFSPAVDGLTTMPATGMWSSVQFDATQIVTTKDLAYTSTTTWDGKPITLKLDLYQPPTTAAARPTVVLIHGGSFVTGSKADMASAARSYAQRGYVAVSIDYRLDPRASAGGLAFLNAGTTAIDDGSESIRWLKSKAATYRIDVTRIATVGTSAGGAIALGIGAHHGPTPTGTLMAYTPNVAAAVSTGATLTPALDANLVAVDGTFAPSLMFHYGTDTVTGFTSTYSRRYCDVLVAAGNACTFVLQPGSGHTISLAAGASSWTAYVGSFLWTYLRLGSSPTTTTSAPTTSSPTTMPTTSAPTTTRPSTTTTVGSIAPKVTLQPTNKAAAAGTTVTATAAATGTPTPKVQWQYSSNGGTSWANIDGATSTTLSLTVLANYDGWKARAVFTNAAGTATTNAATLTVT